MSKIYKVMWNITMRTQKGHRGIYLSLSLCFWALMGAVLFGILSSTGLFLMGPLAGKALEAGIILIGYMALVPGFLGASVYAYRNVPACYFRDSRFTEGMDVRPAHKQKKGRKTVEDHADRFLRETVRQ